MQLTFACINLLPAVLCAVAVHRAYTYRVRSTRPGALTNKAQVLYADSNPANNEATAPVQVLGTCGNPDGSGATPSCGSGFVFLGPADKTITDPALFVQECCVSVPMCADHAEMYGTAVDFCAALQHGH